MVYLDPCITVVVHPVDRKAHPTYPPGYRWAVMAGSRQPADLRYCVNSGHESTIQMASVAGESHGAAACKALRIFGIPAQYSVIELDFDPIPMEADNLPLAKWE